MRWMQWWFLRTFFVFIKTLYLPRRFYSTKTVAIEISNKFQILLYIKWYTERVNILLYLLPSFLLMYSWDQLLFIHSLTLSLSLSVILSCTRYRFLTSRCWIYECISFIQLVIFLLSFILSQSFFYIIAFLFRHSFLVIRLNLLPISWDVSHSFYFVHTHTDNVLVTYCSR